MPSKRLQKVKTTNKPLIAVIIIWIALAILFAFYDLAISKFLLNSGSAIGNLVYSFGEVPGLLFIIFSLFTLNTNAKIKNGTWKKLFFVFEVLVSAFAFIYILRLFFIYFNVSFSFLSLKGISVFLIFALISLMGVYLFKSKFSKFSEKNYFFSKVSVITFVLSGIIIQGLKLFWGRVRFIDLNSTFSDFTAWYIPNGALNGSSFPSGHAYLAWVLIPLFLVFYKKNIWKWVVITLTTIFALSVSYARIVSGAHYASDVLFSGGIVLLIFLILYKKNFRRKALKKKKTPTGKLKKRNKGKQ